MKLLVAAMLGLTPFMVTGWTDAPDSVDEGYDIIVSSPVAGVPIQFDWLHLTDSYRGGLVGLDGSGPVAAPDTISLPAGDFALVVRNLNPDQGILVEVVQRAANRRPYVDALSVASLTVVAVIDGQMSVGSLPDS